MRAIVTGAASGIGRAIAARLEADGAQVLGVDLEPDRRRPGDPFEADLTTREGNRAAVDAAVERFGGLDVRGGQRRRAARRAGRRSSPRTTGTALIALLLTSPFLLAKYAWGALRESDDGRFIAIASAHGAGGLAVQGRPTSSAKHGVLGLVKTLALEGADDGILATARLPGLRAHPARGAADRRPGQGARACPRSACSRRSCSRRTP